MHVSVIGTNEIGLSTAIMLAYMNHFVMLVDDNQAKIELLRNNSLHYYEPYLNDALKIVNSSIYYTTNLTAAIEQSDIVFFTNDIGYNLLEVAHIFAETLRDKFRILVNKSPSQPGLTSTVNKIIREKSSNFSIVYEIPSVNQTSVVMDTFYPEKIVLGVDSHVPSKILEELYNPLIDKSIILPTFVPLPHREDGKLMVTDISSAEIAYHADKVFKGLKSSYVNEISNLAKDNGAKIDEILRVMKVSGINSLVPQYGLGWTRKEYGESFEVLADSAQKSSLEIPLIESALRSNYAQRDILIHRLQKILGNLHGKTIGILGLTYKPFTDDLTDSPAVDIIRVLLEHGCEIKAHDPVANFKMTMKYPDLNVWCCDGIHDLFKDTDIIVLCTEWPEYFDLDWFDLGQTMREARVFDARNCLSQKDFSSMGYELHSFAKE